MIQEIIALAIVFLTILYVLWRFYKNFISKKRIDNSVCAGCASANSCQIKDLKTNYKKKKEGCKTTENFKLQ